MVPYNVVEVLEDLPEFLDCAWIAAEETQSWQHVLAEYCLDDLLNLWQLFDFE